MECTALQRFGTTDVQKRHARARVQGQSPGAQGPHRTCNKNARFSKHACSIGAGKRWEGRTGAGAAGVGGDAATAEARAADALLDTAAAGRFARVLRTAQAVACAAGSAPALIVCRWQQAAIAWGASCIAPHALLEAPTVEPAYVGQCNHHRHRNEHLRKTGSLSNLIASVIVDCCGISDASIVEPAVVRSPVQTIWLWAGVHANHARLRSLSELPTDCQPARVRAAPVLRDSRALTASACKHPWSRTQDRN